MMINDRSRYRKKKTEGGARTDTEKEVKEYLGF
jgi:hypothetical protein